MMNKLVIQDDEGKTTVVPLIRDEITIGRKEGNTIRLTERNVSRRHARILRANGSVVIEDLNSYNGVRVNGSRIQGRCQLALTDRVQIGDYLIEIKSDEAQAGADPYAGQATQPIERVDPMGATPPPTPQAPDPGQPTAIVNVNRIQGQAPPASFGAEALAETDPAGVPVPGEQGHGRMVVLSSNFAGQEWNLTKPAMVIGRTEDNDIVVNHRSISRHHAKIVRENGRYAVVDLQSSNGVRVNGEEYGKVELRRGDVVDLGHVRMRFVEPGEDFVFGRDAQIVDVATGGGGKGLLFGLLALVLIGGGIGIFVLTSGGGGDQKSGEAAAGGVDDGDRAAATADHGDTDTADSAGGNDTSPTPAADDKVAPLLDKARAAVDAEKWAEARQAAEDALDQDPGNADAQKIRDQAISETGNQKLYKELQKAAKKKDHAGVQTKFEQIDDTSIYKEQARDVHDNLRDTYVADATAKAKRLAKAKKCRDKDALAARSRKDWEEAGDAVDQIDCDDGKVAIKDRKPPKDTKKPKDDKKPKNGGGSSNPPNNGAAAATSGKSAAQLTAEARAAAKTGLWGKALRLCEAALAKKHGDQDAAMVCALAACNIKSASKAKRHIKKLRSPTRKGMARQSCLKNGVDIPIN